MRPWAMVPLAALVVAGCGGEAAPPVSSDDDVPAAPEGPGPTDPATLSGMLLHLPDGPGGATIGDDSHCGGGISTEGGSDAFLDLTADGTIEGCFIQLEAPDVFVNSLVVSFPSAELASRAMTADGFGGIVRYYALDCCNAESVDELGAVDGPGDDALEATSPSDTSAVVGWREGAVVGGVSVQRFDGRPGALAEARRLAAVQDERMRSPVVVQADLDDDRLVALEQAAFPVWWLGETFSTPGFPSVELTMSHADPGMVDLDYQPPLRIELFDLAAVAPGSQPDQMLAVADALFDSPCTVREAIDSPAGEAVLVGRHVPDDWFFPNPSRTGWDELVTDDCPVGEPNVWMATVETPDGVLIRVNGALCYNCLAPPDPEVPYRSPDGIRAAVAALEPFDR